MMFGRGYANQNQVVKGISKTTHKTEAVLRNYVGSFVYSSQSRCAVQLKQFT
jgi:hypothetical protein